jgi:hypothetical protein
MIPVFRFEGVEFVPNSPTDAPVSGATITVYRKGAQVAENVEFDEQDTHDLAVVNAGDIAVGDDLALWGHPYPDTQLHVVAINSARTVLTLQNYGAYIMPAVGERLMPVGNAPALYRDSAGFESLGTHVPRTDSAGRWLLYARERALDMVFEGGGLASPMIRVQRPGVQSNPAVITQDVLNYPSLQEAIDALPAGVGGRLTIPAGTFELPSTLMLPKDKSVHLEGAGIGRTILTSADPGMDMIHVKGNECTLRGFTLRGPGGTSSSETAGRGVVVGTLAADEPAGSLNYLRMIDVRVEATAGWSLYYIGHTDTGAQLYRSLAIWNTVQGCEFVNNGAFGLLRMGHSCTTTVFRDCLFGGARGYSTHVTYGDQVHFDNCTFEGSDDTQPYMKLVRCISSRISACRFEHHGGHGSNHDSNEQRFLVIGSGCRTITVDSCRFARNSSSNATPVAIPRIAAIGDDPSQETGLAPASGIVFVNIDVQLPGKLSEPAMDDIVIDHQSEVVLVGGRALFNAASEFPVFAPLRILAAVESGANPDPRVGSRAVTLVSQPFQMRLPVMPQTERDAVPSWVAGDLTVAEESGRLLVRTAANAWAEVVYLEDI